MYYALYRKYRPSDFDSVVGQTAIVKTLKNSIINHNYTHAYMFFGPRGTGKTTVSKIFARNVNCLSPVDGVACKKCSACKTSFSHDCVDIIEIDAASNNGVNEIRELRNNVNLVPSELKYKVYIIDEVHMLTDAAFNALLKTLEEPPEHIIFILATTDPQKVPETIISRCQCFSFKRISDAVIRDRLDYVCKQEKIQIDPEVLERISVLSDGGLRDALGMLDMLTSYTNEKITLEDFNEVNGIVSDADLDCFIQYVMEGNIKCLLEKIAEFNNNGKNLIQIMVQILNYVRNQVVDYYLSDKESLYSIDLLQEFINLLNEKMPDIKKSSNTKVYIEMFLLKFINDHKNDRNVEISTNNQPVDKNIDDKNISREIISKVPENKNLDDQNISREIKSEPKEEIQEGSKDVSLDEKVVEETTSKNTEKVKSFSSSLVPKILNIDEVMSIRINNTMATADKNLLKLEMKCFDILKDFSFDQEIGYLVNSILDSKLRAVGPDNLIISYDSDASVEQNLINLIRLNEVYNKVTNSNKNIAIISDKKWDELKEQYIENLKNNVKYEVQEEPELLLEEIDNNDIMTSSAISLFGEDIVEIE